METTHALAALSHPLGAGFRAVAIRPSHQNETMPPGEVSVAPPVVVALREMLGLDSGQPGLDKSGNNFISVGEVRVREARDPSCQYN